MEAANLPVVASLPVAVVLSILLQRSGLSPVRSEYGLGLSSARGCMRAGGGLRRGLRARLAHHERYLIPRLALPLQALTLSQASLPHPIAGQWAKMTLVESVAPLELPVGTHPRPGSWLFSWSFEQARLAALQSGEVGGRNRMIPPLKVRRSPLSFCISTLSIAFSFLHISPLEIHLCSGLR